jgi:hypothetical protein
MSTMALVEGPNGVFAAWETDGQIYFARSKPGTANFTEPQAAPGAGRGRKHPALAIGARGEILLVWREGTGWQQGGALAWQVFDKDGKPTIPWRPTVVLQSSTGAGSRSNNRRAASGRPPTGVGPPALHGPAATARWRTLGIRCVGCKCRGLFRTTSCAGQAGGPCVAVLAVAGAGSAMAHEQGGFPCVYSGGCYRSYARPYRGYCEGYISSHRDWGW